MRRWSEVWRPYRGVIRAGLANAVEYRTNFLIDTLAWLVVSAAVNMYLWYAVYESSSQTTLASITLPQMLSYIVCATLCASICRKGRFERATGEEIRNGELNKYLVKPITHIGYVLAAATAERIVSLQLTVILVIVVGVPLTLTAGVSLSWSGALCALPILLCGMMIHSLIALMLSYFAFWLDEVWTFHVVKDISFWFLSGQLLPLSTLPPDVLRVSNMLPFQYLAYIPASLIVGTIPASAALPYFAGAFVWMILLYGITLFVWKRGIMRYSAFGG